jgi:stage V sporulation protein S
METTENSTLMTLKVSGTSNPHMVATSIVKNMQEGKTVETLSIGAGATNQAVKAVIIARGLGASLGWDLLSRSGFIDLSIDGEKRTAIKMSIIQGR